MYWQKYDEGCISDYYKVIILDFTNTITPNSDGFNDTWKIPNLEEFASAEMKIFDRYGKEVFQQIVEKEFSWNGTYLGRPLPTGTYWYQLIFPDGTKHSGYIFVKNL